MKKEEEEDGDLADCETKRVSVRSYEEEGREIITGDPEEGKGKRKEEGDKFERNLSQG